MPHAHYEYGPFGEPLRITGPAAALNPFRFSTKRTDPTTDLVLYEYRAYSPTLGRWLSRDPIRERGGRDIYSFTENSPITHGDYHGLNIFSALFCWNECAPPGKRRIDKVGSMILPAEVDPGRWHAIEAAVQALEDVELVNKVIDVNLVNHLLPRIESLFREVVGAVMEKQFVYIYTTIEYSICERVSCCLFWSRLKWVQALSGPRRYVTGAFNPRLGYAGLTEAEEYLDEALRAHASEVLSGP
jgi:RHS repeat-associated protein